VRENEEKKQAESGLEETRREPSFLSLSLSSPFFLFFSFFFAHHIPFKKEGALLPWSALALFLSLLSFDSFQASKELSLTPSN
jgi:hypothetical protein